MLYFLSSNQHKFEELQQIFPDLQMLSIELPEIQSADPKAIITAKLEEALKHHTWPCIVEDTGLYLEGLKGLPGPFIKFFIQKLGTGGLAELSQKLETNKAQATTFIGYADTNKAVHIFEGSIPGQIVSPRADSSFGWDPIFLPDGYAKTFAEMTSEEKNKISMRTRAAEALKTFLSWC